MSVCIDTRFVVDAFSYGKISDCDGYFLTHYHTDHFGGLRANWSHGPIYCSQVTANLVKQELHVNSRYIHALPMNELYPIPGSNVTICLIDANHCPGSVLFLFIIQLESGIKVRHLHTGDFRATPRMCLHPLIRQPENAAINCLYLDTTYLNPQYAFPAQEECIEAVCKTVKEELNMEPKKAAVPTVFDNWIKKKADPMTLGSQVLIVVGTYTIGKERVFFNIAKMLKCKIYAPEKKRNILLCQQDEELKSMLTNDPTKAQVHVVSLRDIRGDIMSKYLNDHRTHFDSLIGFKPTGWTYKSSKSEISDMKLAPLSHIIIPPSDRTLDLSPYYNHKNIKLYGVPYSEHSSFRELASFIASLDIKQIIPTVNINQLDSMKVYFNNWEQEKSSKRIQVVEYPNEDHW
ncbi:DNA repair metallo-beta-lactamase-domain-containing protein [Thamnidium elegans]|nr:DNA repair metallo-beta-lactamase-domain-containing protein [Thamnidium elegans]